MFCISSSDNEPIKPKDDRPKKMLNFSKEPSIDEIDQPVTSAKEQSRPISNTTTVQIPLKTKIQMDAICSNMPSAIAPPTNDHKHSSPSCSYAPEQDTIKEAIQIVFKRNPDLTHSNPTLPMSQPLIFGPKPLHKTIAPDEYSSLRKQISLSTKVAVDSSRPFIISFDFSSLKRYKSCYAPSKPDLQRSEKQMGQDIHRQNIRTLENKPAEHHTLSNPLEGESPNIDVAIFTENFAEDLNDEPLNQNLEPQYEDFCKKDSEMKYLFCNSLSGLSSSIWLSPSAPTPSLSHRWIHFEC